MTRNQTAARVAKSKQQHPEHFCLEASCLWRTAEPFCPRHRPSPELFKAAAVRAAEATNGGTLEQLSVFDRRGVYMDALHSLSAGGAL